ncbi:hypothetical protein VB711_16930 [Cronbergia sp. UHCC 0137]|uniref:hypothetical protein n=1 Tax=Cronbergia sp. UHCC 0137 TaxID=3110239 RepID=UPI002B1F531B|nr:hypothetical protein [Cronbergia sp. UHCC 0137]MEA5619511.1 hypothetical protein [Cronbergia sp. UHCC 0137]
MAELTLAEGLGENATQTATDIILKKADLGITATTATSDQVLAAIAIKAKATHTETQFNTEADQNIYVSDGFKSFITKNDESYILDQITINLAKPDTGATLNPNDY